MEENEIGLMRRKSGKRIIWSDGTELTWGRFFIEPEAKKQKRKRGIRTSTEVENGTGIKEKE
jgi:hypothetical protein